MKEILLAFFLLSATAEAREQFIRCESLSDRYTECAAGGLVLGVSLDQQLSRAACYEGQSFGLAQNRGNIFVAQGCRGIFLVEISDGFNGGGWNGGWNGGGFTQKVRCESWGGAYNECDTGRFIQYVTLRRQISGSPCILGRTWTYDNRVIKVRNGCRGVFDVY